MSSTSASSSSPSPTKKKECQILIIGSSFNRVQKVLSYIQDSTRSSNISNENNGNNINNMIDIKHIPCVAKFGSYKNEETNETIQYLASIMTTTATASESEKNFTARTTTLAPYFDAEIDDKNLGVIAVAIGCGIYDDERDNDSNNNSNNGIDQIKSFLESMTSSNNNTPKVKVIKPNPNFQSMKEENQYYKSLDEAQKEEMGDSIGPRKMAKFVLEFCQEVMMDMGELRQVPTNRNNEEYNEDDDDEIAPTLVEHDGKEDTQETTPKVLTLEDLANKEYYSCKMCRTPIFTQDHYETPHHFIAKHSFSKNRKNNNNPTKSTSSSCQNIFLNIDNIPQWIYDTHNSMEESEGRLSCWKCNAKIGYWKWAGNQCSCGTWVTPAVYFNASRIDQSSNKNDNNNSSSHTSRNPLMNVVMPNQAYLKHLNIAYPKG